MISCNIKYIFLLLDVHSFMCPEKHKEVTLITWCLPLCPEISSIPLGTNMLGKPGMCLLL
jgi:hypothetical protein